MQDFNGLLKKACETHGHLCAGQVLGVRMALRALNELQVDVDLEPKRVIVYVEMDRCAADAVATAARVSLGRRTLKFMDYGKMAATFIDLETERAVRVVALDSARERALAYMPPGTDKHQAELSAYRQMPDDELMTIQQVVASISRFDLPGRPLRRVTCECCGEGINDGREVIRNDSVLCRACADGAYYTPVPEPFSVSPLWTLAEKV